MTALIFGMTALQQGAQPQQPGNPMGYFLPFILIIGIFYFLIIRPQSKRQKEHKNLVKDLKKGDKIVTAGGFHGTVHGVYEDKDTITMEIADKVRVELSRNSVSRVVRTE